MDGFSVASIQSLVTTISTRIASSVDELDVLTQGAQVSEGASFRVPRLAQLTAALQLLSDEASNLANSLDGSRVISPRLQAELGRALPRCDGFMATVNKQLMRVQADDPRHVNWRDVNWTAITVFTDALGAHTRLFGFFVDLLRMNKRSDQDASLDSAEAQDSMEHAEHATRAASTIGGDILDTNGSAATSTNITVEAPPDETHVDSKGLDDEEPPPYEEPVDTAPTVESNSGPSSSQGFASFTKGFKALMTGIISKPGPFVSAMCQAAQHGNVQQMTGFIQQGVDINGRNENGKTPLQCAILSDSEEAARFLLASGADWSSKVYPKMPLLFYAASKGSINIARLFLERGQRVDEKSISGQPYFCDVVSKGNLRGIRFLLDNGANAKTKDITGQPVIAKAVRDGNVELASLLFDYGAKVISTDITGNSLLGLAVNLKALDMVKLLLNRGVPVDSNTIHGTTVLADSISRKRWTTARLLLHHGADGDVNEVTGQPALMGLIMSGSINLSERTQLVRLLLERGASPNCQDFTRRHTALGYAMEKGYLNIVELLLQHGASADAPLANGDPLLCFAISNDLIDLTITLLEKRANPNTPDNINRTPLTLALSKHDFDLARILRKYGAVVDAASARSIRDLAQALERPDILELLS